MTKKKKATRSERLRDQRSRRPRTKAKRSQRRADSGSNSTLPPILVRGGMAASISQGRRKSSRRRYDIALNGQGAEMQLPAVPRVRVGWRLLSGFMVVFLGAALYFLWTTPMLQVQDLNVVGLSHLSKQDLNSVVDVIDNSILLVDPDNIEVMLMEAFPQLVNVSVTTEVPNKVLINLVERQPVLTWTQGEMTHWVDVEGTVFSPHGEWQPAIKVIGELPVIVPAEIDPEQEENDQDLKISAELVDAIITVSREAPKDAPILYDNKYGIGWQDPRGWDAYFGASDEDIEIKLRVYYKTWKRLKKAGIRPALINVEHVHAPYYRLER